MGLRQSFNAKVETTLAKSSKMLLGTISLNPRMFSNKKPLGYYDYNTRNNNEMKIESLHPPTKRSAENMKSPLLAVLKKKSTSFSLD